MSGPPLLSPCIERGTLFGSKSPIHRIVKKPTGKNSMFTTSDAARTIQMCENCCTSEQFQSTVDPFAAGDKPQVRITEDNLGGRKDQ